MSLTVTAGASFEASTDPTTTGLTNTIGVRIVDGAGNTTTARTTSGIVETPASSGIYVATLTAPSVTGQYVIVWDDGAATPTYADEDLTVEASLVVGNQIQLCTVADVREFLQKPDGDTEQDGVISALISRASAAIQRYCDREFITTTSGSTLRTFETDIGLTGGFLSLSPYDLQSVSLIRMDTDLTPFTLSTDEYRLYPINKPDGVYTSIRLQPLSFSTGRVMWPLRQVQVTGTWGWPSVPVDVQHACLVTVSIWLKRDVQAFSRVFNVDEGRLERPDALPAAAVAALEPFRRGGVF
jgi:hypothetical protein